MRIKHGMTRQPRCIHMPPLTLHIHQHAPCLAQDPLAIIGIVSILFPFLILGIAIASGYLDLSPYQYPHH